MRAGRPIEVLETERGGWIALGILVAVSVALSLWVTRGTTFFVDELRFFDAYRGFNVQELLSQHNGHLVLIPRLIYATGFKLFGSDYFFYRLLEAVGVGLAGALAYVLARQRVGGALALAVAAPLLFLGSSWDATLSSIGIPATYAIVFGLAAILAARLETRRGDLLACLMLTLSVATFSVGLAFAVGVGVSVLMRPSRWRGAWIFAVPLFLWGAWRIGDPGLHGPLFESSAFHLSNVLLIPSYSINAAASLAAAVTGLGYDFGRWPLDAPPPTVGGPFGPPLAVLVVVVLVLRFRHTKPPPTLWPLAAALLALWASFALSSGFFARTPDASRYVYPSAAIALPLFAEAAAGIRLRPRIALAVLLAVTLSLASNISLVRSAGAYLRSYAISARADLGAIELARDHVASDFAPRVGQLASPILGAATQAGTYLSAAGRIGSLGYSPTQIAQAPELARREADQVLAEALAIQLVPSRGLAPSGRVQLDSPRSRGPPARWRRRPAFPGAGHGPPAPLRRSRERACRGPRAGALRGRSRSRATAGRGPGLPASTRPCPSPSARCPAVAARFFYGSLRRGSTMLGADTVISSVIRLVTTIAILAAVYFLIIKPVLDTTKTISHDVNRSVNSGPALC